MCTSVLGNHPSQKAEVRPVTSGVARENDIAITQGLKVGETVVTDGHLRLVPGARVSVKAALSPVPAPGRPSGES